MTMRVPGMNPSVSICTAVLNQSEYLRRMIESVRAQTFPDWELIIVDDGSTEDIKSLVESFNDDRILYDRFQENRGIPHGMNRALSMACGTYVQPLSADEFLWDKKLEIQVAWMDDHPGIGATWGLPTPNRGTPWPLGETLGFEQYQHRAHNRSNEAWIRTLLRQENVPIGGASMLMRRSCYDEIGGFDPAFFDVSDLEWFVRFFQCFKGWILPYRLADADHPETRLTGPSPGLAERVADDLRKLHQKHKIVLPPIVGRVTIGIPVRNMEKFVAKSIQSVLNQSFTDFDLVILDDASEDGTLAEVQKFTDPRISLLQVQERIGVAAANNQILAMAKTPFYVPFSADDVLEPTFLERCLAEFARDPFLEFVGTQTDFIDVEDKPVTEHAFLNIPKARNKPRDRWLFELYHGNQYFGAGMYRTGTVIDLGGWDSTVGVITDYDMYLKLLMRENIHVIEEHLTHTRAHDGQQSILKTQPERQKLRQDYADIKRRYYLPRQKVIIATPFYEMRGFSPYIASLTASCKMLGQIGIDYEFWELSGDSYVDRAKNTIVNKFLEDPEATDLFMIDSDMQWSPGSLINMVLMPQEIIMGSYPQKNGWERFTAVPLLTDTADDGKMHPVGIELSDGSALLQAAFLAGGFIKIKRCVLEQYKEAYKDHIYLDPGADPSMPNRVYTEFFTCERKANAEGLILRWGEDRVFGARMEAIGVKGWIYPNIDFGHYGIKGWMGNFDKHLRTGETAQ